MNPWYEALVGIQPRGWDNLLIVGLVFFVPLAALLGARVAIKATLVLGVLLYLLIAFVTANS